MNTNKSSVFMAHPLISAFLGDLSIAREKEFRSLIETTFAEQNTNQSQDYSNIVISDGSFVSRFATFINQHRKIGLKFSSLDIESDHETKSLVGRSDDVYAPNMYMVASFMFGELRAEAKGEAKNGKSMTVRVKYNVNVSISDDQYHTSDFLEMNNKPVQIEFIW